MSLKLCLFKVWVPSTVFCRIHALAGTPKNPEGRLYSSIIRSKSKDVGGFGDSRTSSFVFNGGKIARSCVGETGAHWDTGYIGTVHILEILIKGVPL